MERITGVSYEQRTAYVLLRIAVGIDFMGHGFVRLLHGHTAYAQGMVKLMADTPLPSTLVYGFGWILPFFEAALGLLLFAGISTRWVLTAGALWMFILMSGTALRQDWQAVALQLFYSFLFSLLLFLRERYDMSWPALLGRR